MSDLTNESDMVLIKHFCLACNVYVTHIVQCTDLAFSITQFMKLIRLLFCQNYGKIWRKKSFLQSEQDFRQKKISNRKSKMFYIPWQLWNSYCFWRRSCSRSWTKCCLVLFYIMPFIFMISFYILPHFKFSTSREPKYDVEELCFFYAHFPWEFLQKYGCHT